MNKKRATLTAGIPSSNATLYWLIRFSVGDPAACIELPLESGGTERVLMIRDIEMARAKKHARADRVVCPNDFAPPGGLAGDRETATAQAAAECLKRSGIQIVTADRTLPLIYAEIIRAQGIAIECDFDLGVTGRRKKDELEIEWIREAQSLTESGVRLGCEMIARSTAAPDGRLICDGQILTAERVRYAIDLHLLKAGCALVPWIVAPGIQGGDCHEHGSGDIRTEEPVIIDVYPMGPKRYCGDCTRTVVHGKISDTLKKMHAAVIDAKHSAEKTVRAGVAADTVHQTTVDAIKRHGFEYGLPGNDSPDSFISLQHGTGHGLGLSVHEPPLLDFGGPELIAGDVITIEPGLYGKSIGGIRVEDVVVVTENGCENIGNLPEGLEWK